MSKKPEEDLIDGGYVQGRKRQLFVIAADSPSSIRTHEVPAYLKLAIAKYNKLCNRHGEAHAFHIGHNGHKLMFKIEEVPSAMDTELSRGEQHNEKMARIVKTVNEVKEILGEPNFTGID